MPPTDTTGGTYSGDPSLNNVAAVRFELGDTQVDPGTRMFTDNEVEYALAQEQNHVLKAAARLAEVAAGRFARKGDTRTSGIQSNKNSISKKYMELANRLRARAVTSGSFLYKTKAQADNLKKDTSLRQPKFRVGMTDHYQTISSDDESGV